MLNLLSVKASRKLDSDIGGQVVSSFAKNSQHAISIEERVAVSQRLVVIGTGNEGLHVRIRFACPPIGRDRCVQFDGADRRRYVCRALC